MTSRELLKDIVALKPAGRCGLWLGNPHPDSWPGLHRYFGTSTEEELRRKLGDDYRWISPSFAESTFPDPALKGIFNWNWQTAKESHGQEQSISAHNNDYNRTSFGADFNVILLCKAC
ncbi:MAG: hypothetical protein HGA24_10665 [Candidatus Aminicenantes bacterium]|nr:hypothetical protein [Candidatus Aminicenantes bacterium]